MGQTGAFAEIVSVTVERKLEADCEPMTHEQMAEAFESSMESAAPEDADIDLRGSDVFAA